MRIVLAILVLVLAAAGALAVRSNDPSAVAATEAAPATTTTATATTTTAAPEPPMLGQALALSDLDGWLQTDISALDDLHGQVVIVWFWTFGCYNCKNTIPYLQDIYAQYHDKGLEIVG
ncbi:MAG: redoxin domain-containing protein, partial [Acidimicrobiia bacterium]